MTRKTCNWLCCLMLLSACLAEEAEKTASSSKPFPWGLIVIVLAIVAIAALLLRRGSGSGGSGAATHTPPRPIKTGDVERKPAPVLHAQEDDARRLQALTQDCERLERLFDDMQKLYGGAKGIQRLGVLVENDIMAKQSVEQMMLESKTRELVSFWREYKALQAKYAGPEYDRPYSDPDREQLRQARMMRLREPHPNADAYDALERQA